MRPGHDDLVVLLADLAERASGLPPADIPAFLGDLERLRVALWTRCLGSTPQRRENTQPPDDRLLDVKAAAHFLSISRTAVRRLEASGLLPSVRIGRRLIFRTEALQRFTDDRETRRNGVG